MTTKKSNTAKRRAKSTRSTINNNWKKETFSMSALVRYAKGKGKADVEKLLKEMNEKHGTNVKLSSITTQNIVKHATERELNKNAGSVKNYVKGEKKLLFSFWLVILTCGRLVQAAKSSKVSTRKAA